MGFISALRNIFRRSRDIGTETVAAIQEETNIPDPTEDPTGWLLESGVAQVILMHTHEIKVMCMFGYALLNGYKLYPKFPDQCALSYRFISMILANTGGGILVPIFINAIPVSLSDTYPIVIIMAVILHELYPILREVIGKSPVFKIILIFMYECNRAAVLVKLSKAATAAIPPSEFDFPVFGPIFCGAIGGCGGAFLPLSKGLDPIKEGGLAQPMFSAFIASTCFHFFINTSLSDGVIEPVKKAQLLIAVYFIIHNVYATYFKSVGKAHVNTEKKMK